MGCHQDVGGCRVGTRERNLRELLPSMDPIQELPPASVQFGQADVQQRQIGRRGAAGEPSGMTTDHLRQLLDNTKAGGSQWFLSDRFGLLFLAGDQFSELSRPSRRLVLVSGERESERQSRGFLNFGPHPPSSQIMSPFQMEDLWKLCPECSRRWQVPRGASAEIRHRQHRVPR